MMKEESNILKENKEKVLLKAQQLRKLSVMQGNRYTYQNSSRFSHRQTRVPTHTKVPVLRKINEIKYLHNRQHSIDSNSIAVVIVVLF